MFRQIIISLLLIFAARSEPDFTAVRTLLKNSVEEGTVAGGSVMVLHRGTMIFETGFGFMDIKTKKPYRVDTPAIIASISKPILGTAAFRLLEAGKLKVDIPISEYLPEFSNLKLESGTSVIRAPTMIELLTHTSGLRNDTAQDGRPWLSSWVKGQTLSYVVKKYALDFPFKANPGTRYAYSGIGTDVVARVTEVVAGKNRNALLEDEVSRPLGMRHTYYWTTELVKKLPPMPTRYYRGKNGELLISQRSFPAPGTYSSSGGTIISTAPDLARWLLMIRNRGIHQGTPYLAPKTIRKMLLENKIGNNAQVGLFIRKKNVKGETVIVGHTGSSGTNCWIDFKNDVIGIMLTQTRGKDIRPFRIELEERITACVSNL